MESTIILISGKQGSGKTTLANSLAENLSRKENTFVNLVNFADTLYEMHDAVLKVLRSKGIVREGVKDGELLQLLGTQYGRQCIGEQVWVDCLKNEIAARAKKYKDDAKVYFIVGDCRFENEFAAFPQALRIRLEAHKEVRMKRCSYWRENDEHASEISLDKHSTKGLFDMTLRSDLNTVVHSETMILAQIDKDNWRGKR